MNQHELDQLLREIPLPDRSDSYWKEFPTAVVRRIQSDEPRAVPRTPESGEPVVSRRRRRWLYSMALPAAAAVALLFVIPWKRPATPTPNDEQLQALRVCYRQVAELFPRQLEAVVLGPDGAQIQLSETP